MKTKLILFTLLWPTALALMAATLTIEVPTNDVPRVTEAFGSILGLGRNANQAEVSAACSQWVISQTKDYERRKNMVQFTPPPLEMQTPTPTPGGLAAVAAAAPQSAPTATPTTTVTATPEAQKKSDMTGTVFVILLLIVVVVGGGWWLWKKKNNP
jgi:hypothetical protein